MIVPSISSSLEILDITSICISCSIWDIATSIKADCHRPASLKTVWVEDLLVAKEHLDSLIDRHLLLVCQRH